MKTEEEKRWDEVFKKNLILDDASVDFTDNVMQRIDAMEELKEKALGNLFKKYVHEEPSALFSEKIMSQLIAKPGFVYEPVISKRAWFVIGLIAAAIFILVIRTSPTEELNNPVYSNLILKLNKLIDIELPAIFSSKLLAISLTAGSMLMVLEAFFRSRQKAW
jgi:hypothetical protein